MRTNTPSAGLFESAAYSIASSKPDLFGSSSRNRYPPPLLYSSLAWEISASVPETQQRYISGYGKVLSRTWNGTERLIVGGLFHPPVLSVSVHCTLPLFRVSSNRLGDFAPRVVSLEMLAAQSLCPVTDGHLVLATAASAGCPGMGRTKGHVWKFPLFLGRESGS